MPANAIRVKLVNHSYFQDFSYYQAYVDNRYKRLSMPDSSGNYDSLVSEASTIMNSSLTSNNFNYKISSAYVSNNNHYVDVDITVNNVNNVNSYYDSNLNNNIYYVPVYFEIQYADKGKCVDDLSSNYTNYTSHVILKDYLKEVNMYRYVTKTNVYLWSNETEVEGYTRTGKTRQG